MFTFSSKDPNETELFVFDFLDLLNPGETITGAAVTVTVSVGTDGVPSAMLSGSASISGTQVSQMITGGITGNTYHLECAITTSLGQELVTCGLLPIILC